VRATAKDISREAFPVKPLDPQSSRLRLARWGPRPPGADAWAARRILEVLRTPPAGCIERRVCGPRLIARAMSIVAMARSAASEARLWPVGLDDRDRLIGQGRRLRDDSGYVTINPVWSDLLARSDNQLNRARNTTRDVEILCLRWLYLDIDP
jgi:hypothetical protein